MVFDAHSDIFSDFTNKSLQGESDIFRKYHIDRLRAGNVEGSIFVIWIDPPYDAHPRERMEQILAAVEKEKQCSSDILRIVTSVSEAEKALKDNLFYAFIGLEGLSGIGEDLSQIDRLYKLGARHASLTWNEENALATGLRGRSERGVTELGKKAIRSIEDKKMLLDVSHLNDASFWDVMRYATGPVVATHSSSRALCSAGRNLTDEMIKALVATGGMVGVNSYKEFTADEEENRTVDKLAAHVDHMVEVAGIEHIGFGFDFFEFLEGGAIDACSFEEVQASAKKGTPSVLGMKDASEIGNLLKALEKVGFTRAELQKLKRDNWIQTLQKVLGS